MSECTKNHSNLYNERKLKECIVVIQLRPSFLAAKMHSKFKEATLQWLALNCCVPNLILSQMVHGTSSNGAQEPTNFSNPFILHLLLPTLIYNLLVVRNEATHIKSVFYYFKRCISKHDLRCSTDCMPEQFENNCPIQMLFVRP